MCLQALSCSMFKTPLVLNEILMIKDAYVFNLEIPILFIQAG